MNSKQRRTFRGYRRGRLRIAARFTVLFAALLWLIAMNGCKKDSAGGASSNTKGAPTTSAPAASGLAKALVGHWRIDLGVNVATYEFAQGGTYNVTFTGPQGGTVRGTWTIEGDQLFLQNTSSTTPFAVVGERESGKIAELDDSTLKLTGTGSNGRPDQFVLRRTIPFKAGSVDNPKIIGAWRASNGNQSMVMALSADGTLAQSNGTTGHWSQAGKQLILQISVPPPAATQPATTRVEPDPAGSLIEIPLNIVSVDDATLVIQDDQPRKGGASTSGGNNVVIFTRQK